MVIQGRGPEGQRDEHGRLPAARTFRKDQSASATSTQTARKPLSHKVLGRKMGRRPWPRHGASVTNMSHLLGHACPTSWGFALASAPRRFTPGARAPLAHDFDEEPPPARYVRTLHAQSAGRRPAAVHHPWDQPRCDLRREMADGVSARPVDPDGRRLLGRRIGNEQEGVAGFDALQVLGARSEDGSVHRGAEPFRGRPRKGRIPFVRARHHVWLRGTGAARRPPAVAIYRSRQPKGLAGGPGRPSVYSQGRTAYRKRR